MALGDHQTLSKSTVMMQSDSNPTVHARNTYTRLLYHTSQQAMRHIHDHETVFKTIEKLFRARFSTMHSGLFAGDNSLVNKHRAEAFIQPIEAMMEELGSDIFIADHSPSLTHKNSQGISF